jgi:glycosyltransferase involved in cell wall biosynthesis
MLWLSALSLLKNNMEIRISVVIPTYNRPELLQRCLYSLITQNFAKDQYEVIVVSDGPDTTTERIVLQQQAMSEASIAYHFLSKKGGPAAARNLGWQQAKGILIAFTDDDCIPDTNWLKEIWRYYKMQDEIAYTGKVVVPIPKHPTDFELNTSRLETGEFVTANCVLTKQALIKLGGFDERFKAAWREDSDLHFNLIEHNIPIHKNEKAIVVHPARLAKWGVSIREQKKSLYNALLYKKYPHLYRQRIKAKPTWLYYNILILFVAALVMLVIGLIKLSLIAFSGWLILTAWFASIRLKHTSHSLNHVSEMIVTSFAIPFLSVYWTLYGAWKYRVLFF